MERDGERVIGRKLAEWLEVSAPTVTATLRRMIDGGWVEMNSTKSVSLTTNGRKVAASVMRRHMLAELLLARVLGIPWSRVHDEADRIEHGLSVETAERVALLVDDPQVCPHGNPLPGCEDSMPELLPLLDADLELVYRLARVHEEVERNSELMAFFEAHGLVPGATVALQEVMPFNETVVLRANGQPVVIGLAVARKLWLTLAPV
jgi:DtxR family Mn-dependent transcriptional regulator